MWYFAYGSNLCRDRLLHRVPSARFGRVARLPEHDFRFHKRGRDGSGKANAYPTGSPEDVVWGVLVELDAVGLTSLDPYEPEYDRRVLEVEASDGTPHQAYVYVAQRAAVDPSLLPFRWYRQMVVGGGAARGLPDRYLHRIAAQTARPGPQPRWVGGEC